MREKAFFLHAMPGGGLPLAGRVYIKEKNTMNYICSYGRSNNLLLVLICKGFGCELGRESDLCGLGLSFL
jgi:hypothetical protein